MKRSSIIQATLAVVIATAGAFFQSCGGPSVFSATKASGNGTGYEGQQPSEGAPIVATFVYQGQCADPALNESVIVAAGSVYSLTVLDCRALEPAQILPSDQVEIRGEDVVYQGRTFVKRNNP